jgi:nucleoside-diphosphate-sugar epimerase
LVTRCISDSTWRVRGALRRQLAAYPPDAEFIMVGDLAPDTDWSRAVTGADVVVHTAARVHVMHDRTTDPLAEFRRANVEGTTNLARQAAAAGVRRLVYVSSIKVNGERNVGGRPFRADDLPAPIDPYSISKHEAEEGLHRVASETGLEVVVIRPVLVYGPGVKANVAAMMRWLRRGVPLPLGAVHNKRSLVALGNLVDLILTGVNHPAAPGGTFLVSDGEDLSTTELLRRTAAALGVTPRLIPVPQLLLRFGARALGRPDLGLRLLESLQVDIGPTKLRLGWTPPVTVNDALREMTQDFLRRAPRR